MTVAKSTKESNRDRNAINLLINKTGCALQDIIKNTTGNKNYFSVEINGEKHTTVAIHE